jgi:hypothetical protein
VAAGGVALLTWRYDRGAVVVRPLKDGYYLVVCLGGGGLAPVLVHRTAEAQARMNEAL